MLMARPSSSGGGGAVANNRVRGRGEARFPGAYTNPRDKQLPETLRHTGQKCEQAENGGSCSDNASSAVQIRHTTQRQCHQRVEQSEGEALEHTELGVA